MSTREDRVCEHFQQEASHYDRLIPKLIPHYREQHAMLRDLIPFPADRPLRALDLGCGTGALSEAILATFPQAEVVAFDIADRMLDIARQRLATFGDRVSFQQGDFSRDDLGDDYDLAVSGLALHHLEDERKPATFQQIFRALKPGGVFLNRDIVLGATAKLARQYEQLWRQFMRSNGEDDDHWFGKHREEDRPATVAAQLNWLQQAGFIDVGCHWQSLNFAIYGGYKPDSLG